MAIYAVGDIQGCYEPLIRLLDKVNFDPVQDRLWAAGDLVNRGPKSLETLRFLKSLGSSFHCVLGNHDLHFLAMATGAFTEGKKDTLLPLLNAPDCEELCDWLRFFPLLHHQLIETQTGQQSFIMVHAGIAASWSLEDALGYSKEVEMALQGSEYRQFLKSMYGNEPNRWESGLIGEERLRVITNTFTRMRFCNKDGELDFTAKSDLSSAPEDYYPWYKFQNLNKTSTLLFGHWAMLDGVTNAPNIYALDTGCVWGRCLSALRLQDKQLFCTDCP